MTDLSLFLTPRGSCLKEEEVSLISGPPKGFPNLKGFGRYKVKSGAVLPLSLTLSSSEALESREVVRPLGRSGEEWEGKTEEDKTK